MAEIGRRLEELIAKPPSASDSGEFLGLGEEILENWLTAKGKSPTSAQREGFRLLALHRQGADKNPSFNACRETCRELAWHYNLLVLQPDHPEADQRVRMMGWVANHLYLFISGKMEHEGLGEFCCASKPLRETVDAEQASQ